MTRNAGFWCRSADVRRAAKTAPEIKEETASEIVDRAVKIGLYDKTLFHRYGILTSPEIQQNYFEAAYTRPNLAYDERYLLLDPQEYIKNKEAKERQNAERNARRGAAPAEPETLPTAADGNAPDAQAAGVPERQNAGGGIHGRAEAAEVFRAVAADLQENYGIEPYRFDIWIRPIEPEGFDADGNLVLSVATAAQMSVVQQGFLSEINEALNAQKPGAIAVLKLQRAPAARAEPDGAPETLNCDMSQAEAAAFVKAKIGYAAAADKPPEQRDMVDEFANHYTRACTDRQIRTYSGLKCNHQTFIGLAGRLSVDAALHLMYRIRNNSVDRDKYHYLCASVVNYAKERGFL
jgi:hypothetical protein